MEKPSSPGLVRCALLLLAMALPLRVAHAATPAASPRPVLNVATPSTKADLLRFIGDGVVLDAGDDNELTLWPDGKASVSLAELYRGDAMTSLECPTVGQKSGTWSMAGNSVRLSGSMRCTIQHSQMGGPVPPEKFVADESFTLHVRHASPGALVFEIQKAQAEHSVFGAGVLWVVGACATPAGQPLRRCEAHARSSSNEYSYLVEVLPGAKSRAPVEAVEGALLAAPIKALSGLFEGPPAKKQRETTEVYFREGFEAQARAVAEALAPVIGKVDAKAWPGAWDYDVIVVVGETLAPGAAAVGHP